MYDFPLLLAFDFGGVIFLLFALLSFISWIVNQAKGAKQNPPPRRPQQPVQRNPQVQREIERFLREAGGQQQRPDRPIVDADEIEIVQSPSGRRPPTKRRKVEKPRPSPGARSATPLPSSAAADRPGQRLADRHLAAAPKSAVASEHLSQRVAAEHLPDDVSKSVSQHLGVFAAAQPTGTGRNRRSVSADFLNTIRTPDGMRTAFIMQEILQRPRTLRRRGS
ncbi:MAG: hypothetical protein JNG89_11010 [Planctomycetaceae bacterium]|nr:hypothetical protein [Planctomycetaceae bacterium]